jgi:hypothetical protein
VQHGHRDIDGYDSCPHIPPGESAGAEPGSSANVHDAPGRDADEVKAFEQGLGDLAL